MPQIATIFECDEAKSRATYRIEFMDALAPADLRIIEEGLRRAGEHEWQQQPYVPLAFLSKDEFGTVVGGVVGNTGGPWLYVSALWVMDRLRGQGLGSKLMDAAEAEAIARGCTGAYLDTSSQHALEFYRARGYERFGQLEAGPAQPVRYFLRRTLVRSNAQPPRCRDDQLS